MENENMFTGFEGETGAEELEVAEPTSEEGAEELEVAEPTEPVEPQRSEADAAFAELRRRAEEAEKARRETEMLNEQMREALGLYFDGETPEDLAIAARANAYGVDPEIERARAEAERRSIELETQNRTLEEQLMQIKVEKAMAEGLRELQQIDPNIKSLDGLDDAFYKYISAGLSTTDAYWAAKAKEMHETKNAPKAIGTVEAAPSSSGYFSKEEVDNMTDAEIEANLEAIKKSMSKWK